MPAVRATMDEKIGRAYRGLDLTLECFPGDEVEDDPDAYLAVGLALVQVGFLRSKGVCFGSFQDLGGWKPPVSWRL